MDVDLIGARRRSPLPTRHERRIAVSLLSVVENAPASAPNSVGCAAAASVREGLEETLAVLTLGLSDRLRQSLATTNAIESLISRTGM